jgi:hypothetical protein
MLNWGCLVSFYHVHVRIIFWLTLSITLQFTYAWMLLCNKKTSTRLVVTPSPTTGRLMTSRGGLSQANLTAAGLETYTCATYSRGLSEVNSQASWCSCAARKRGSVSGLRLKNMLLQHFDSVLCMCLLLLLKQPILLKLEIPWNFVSVMLWTFIVDVCYVLRSAYLHLFLDVFATKLGIGKHEGKWSWSRFDTKLGKKRMIGERESAPICFPNRLGAYLVIPHSMCYHDTSHKNSNFQVSKDSEINS